MKTTVTLIAALFLMIPTTAQGQYNQNQMQQNFQRQMEQMQENSRRQQDYTQQLLLEQQREQFWEREFQEQRRERGRRYREDWE
jgi:type III secretory pathway component EscR